MNPLNRLFRKTEPLDKKQSAVA
ncbi:hypothetical protein MNBD_ALPHA02-1337, partial [hydrothermal vent metagenome]